MGVDRVTLTIEAGLGKRLGGRCYLEKVRFMSLSTFLASGLLSERARASENRRVSEIARWDVRSPGVTPLTSIDELSGAFATRARAAALVWQALFRSLDTSATLRGIPSASSLCPIH